MKSALAPNKCFITRVQSLSVQVGCFYLRLDLGLHLLLADSVGQCAWVPQPGASGAGLAGLRLPPSQLTQPQFPPLQSGGAGVSSYSPLQAARGTMEMMDPLGWWLIDRGLSKLLLPVWVLGPESLQGFSLRENPAGPGWARGRSEHQGGLPWKGTHPSLCSG